MGSELRCWVTFGKQESEGKALLETSEIIFRGDFRFKIPFASIQSVEVKGDTLHIRTADGVAQVGLAAGRAAKWREKILHPKSRIEKLGVKRDAKVSLMGFADEDNEFLDELRRSTKYLFMKSINGDTEWIFLKAETLNDLAQLCKISKGMRGAMGMWVVYPKGNLKGEQKITEGDVLSSGRAAGLKDVKVVGFSTTHTALKFVIPVAKR